MVYSLLWVVQDFVHQPYLKRNPAPTAYKPKPNSLAKLEPSNNPTPKPESPKSPKAFMGTPV